MRIILVLFVILLFGLIGYYIKLKYENECFFLNYVDEFVSFYYSNVMLFKNNAIEIINNYIIMQENKNAKFNNLFIKNNNLYLINDKILSKYVVDKKDISIIKTYLLQVGKNDYEYEKEKSKIFLEFLKKKKEESLFNLKNKGVLYFKILLSIGAVLAILIW